MAIACSDFNSYMFRQLPHFDEAILKDFFPTDNAWIGQMANQQFEPFTGSSHTYDQMHSTFPNLTGCWTPINTDAGGCLPSPCATPESVIGRGSTRRTYGIEKTSVRTDVFCFDELITIPKAKQQVAQIISNLRDASMTVLSDRNRRAALQENIAIYIAGSALASIPVTDAMFGPECTEIRLGTAANLPTSMLTLPYLQRLVPGLKYDGYFKKQYIAGGMLKLITDEVTAFQLTNGNPQLIANYRYTDFEKGGALFKYGMSTAVGNFGIAYDFFPARYYHVGGGVLRRVFPYTNVDATIGLKQQVSEAYLNAPYQMNYIWHPEALVRMTPQMVTINPEMPFLNRNLAGKWNFTGPESDTFSVTDPATGQTCTYDNRRRNQGFFWADFQVGYKAEYMQWTRAILSLRDPGCVSDMPRCSVIPAYVIQDNNAANDVCLES